MNENETFDVVVVGGGPAGATAAHDLARQGRSVLLLDRAGRIKPCGGAIPPRLIKDFGIPDELLVARARSARMISPADVKVDIPIEGGFVGMVDREVFDEWLRERAAASGASAAPAPSSAWTRDDDGTAVVHFRARRTGVARARRQRCAHVPSSAPTARARRWRGRRCPGPAHALRVRLPRDRARAPVPSPRLRRLALRRLLPRHALARLLRLGVPARRHHEHRHRQRRQGLLAAQRHRRGCARPPGSRGPRPCAARARRSR
jgi:hypothetical protein